MKKRNKLKKSWFKFAAPVAIISALTLGCGSSNNDFVFNPQNSASVAQTGALDVVLNLANARTVSPIFTEFRVVLLQNNEIIRETRFERAQTGTTQTLSLQNIPFGDYDLLIEFLNSDDDVLGSFRSPVSIDGGATTIVTDPDFDLLTFTSSRDRTILLPTGSQGFDVTVADFNNDNINDLAVGGYNNENLNDSRVHVFLGNADGSYQDPMNLQGAREPREIQHADLDDDGNIDLIVAGWSGGDQVSIHYGNGDGTFAAEENLGNGGVHSVKIADVDEDNNLDIVAADDESIEIDIFLGDGARNFTPQASVPGVEDWATRVEVVDLNGDDNLDLAFLDRESAIISVALGNGDGTFGARTDFPIQASRAFSMDSGDVDGDGDIDLVVSNRNSSSVPVLINDGTGSFSSGGTASVGQDVIWVELADVTDDGILDIIASCAGDSAVFVARGNGNGTFADGSANSLATGTGPWGLTVADVDQDGRVDIVTAIRGVFGNQGSIGGTGSVSIFFGD